MDELERSNLQYQCEELIDRQNELSAYLKRTWRFLSSQESSQLMTEIQTIRKEIQKIQSEVNHE